MHKLAIMATASLAVGVSAQAAELPKQDNFRVSYTFTSPAGTKPVTIGPNRAAAVNVGMMTAVNADGKPFMNGMSGRCLSTFQMDGNEKVFENSGYCQFVDADGDHIYERYTYASQPLGPKNVGEGQWIGGTGKYTGASGTFRIESGRIASATEGAIQTIGMKIGSYTLKEKTAEAK
ncbi:hypothetical protein [Methylobacterium sp. ID0610]|uniref:hypothetical protein n=1 Tax=Methylobacterium carpenticola TaxID=3344827 RepID=UPI0036C9AEAC